MKTIKVMASLRGATREDIFWPYISDNPRLSESIRDNTLVFLFCPVRKKFVGVQTFSNTQDVADALIPLNAGTLCVLKEKTTASTDKFVFSLCLEQAVADQLTESPDVFRFGLTYFLLLDNKTASPPLILSQNTDLAKLKDYLKTKQVYLVSKQQTFSEIPKEKRT